MSNNLMTVNFPTSFGTGKTLKFTYTNWRGVTEDRTVTPLSLQFGTTPEHPKPTWLLFSFCHDRRANRSFMLTKIDGVEEVQQ